MSLADEVRAAIRDVPDFPRPGILFKDITPLLLDGALLQRTCAWFAEEARRLHATALAGIESRGFVFAAGAAIESGLGMILLRKKGRLPGKKVGVTYDLEYGQDTMEAHADAAAPEARILLLDDVLATGGTAAAGCALIEKIGGRVSGCRFLIEIASLKGRLKLPGRDAAALVLT